MDAIPPGPAYELKTLFFDATLQAAVLVTNRNGHRRDTPMQFRDAHDALNWALANRCTFVMIPGPDPKSN
jgi:hypothetical protein